MTVIFYPYLLRFAPVGCLDRKRWIWAPGTHDPSLSNSPTYCFHLHPPRLWSPGVPGCRGVGKTWRHVSPRPREFQRWTCSRRAGWRDRRGCGWERVAEAKFVTLEDGYKDIDMYIFRLSNFADDWKLKKTILKSIRSKTHDVTRIKNKLDPYKRGIIWPIQLCCSIVTHSHSYGKKNLTKRMKLRWWANRFRSQKLV